MGFAVSWMFEDRKAYGAAEREAARAVARLDPQAVAHERGVRFDQGSGRFFVPFFSQEVIVTLPGATVRSADGQAMSGAVAVLALHYLSYRGEPLPGQGWRAYREMPGARHFAPAFERMAEERLAHHFGKTPWRFALAADLLGGKSGDAGEFSFVFRAFPRLKIMAVLWPSDEEFEGSAKLLFPPGAPYYLHSEDLAALGVVLAERLVALDQDQPPDRGRPR